MTEHYEYASFKTLEAAQRALENAYASGDVVEGERPRIIKRWHGLKSAGTTAARYVIMLGGE